MNNWEFWNLLQSCFFWDAFPHILFFWWSFQYICFRPQQICKWAMWRMNDLRKIPTDFYKLEKLWINTGDILRIYSAQWFDHQNFLKFLFQVGERYASLYNLTSWHIGRAVRTTLNLPQNLFVLAEFYWGTTAPQLFQQNHLFFWSFVMTWWNSCLH